MTTPDLYRWIAPLGWALIHFAWQGLVVAIVAWAGMTLARSPRVRYAIGCLAMLTMLAFPIATVSRIGPIVETPDTSIDSAPGLARELARASVNIFAIDFRSGSRTTRVVSIRDRIERAAPAIVATWTLGVLLLATRSLIGFAQLARLRRLAAAIVDPIWLGRVRLLSTRLRVRRRVALFVTARLDCPAVVGVVRPAILWPLAALTGLTPTQVDALLAHELAHVRRHDYGVNLVQTLVETLLFYHPAVWWLSHRVRQEREHCCDDLAATAIGDRATYAGALVAMESRRQPSLAMSAGGGSLMRRVRRLLVPDSTRRRSPVGVGLIVTTLVLVGVFACKPREPVAVATTRPATQALDDRLAAGDLLRVSIGELEAAGSTSQVFKRIAADGTITLPYLKSSLEVRGLTVAAAEQRIATAYGEAHVIADANVGVLVVQGADGRSVPPGLFETADGAARRTAPQAMHDRIVAGDLLRVTVMDLVGPGVQSVEIKRVERDGTIAMPMIGSVDAAGATATDVQRKLVDAYRSAQILNDASVNVLIVQDAEGHALVPTELLANGGAKPTIDLSTSMAETTAGHDEALADAYARILKDMGASAGGDAAQHVAAASQSADKSSPTKPNAAQLVADRKPLLDALAAASRDHGEASDEALAVRGLLSQLDRQIATATGLVGEYYVSGSIGAPGVYSLTGRRITLLQALTAAGCAASSVPDEDPAHDFGIDVVRRDPATGHEVRQRLRWSDATHGKLEKFYLMPDDQVIVGVGSGRSTTTTATARGMSE